MDRYYDRYVVIHDNVADFYKAIGENKPVLMGYLLLDNYYEEVIMYMIDRWNNGEELELLT